MNSVNFRDAGERDASRLAEIANDSVMTENISKESMKELVHERTIKIAETGSRDEDDENNEDDDDKEILGYVSYEARPEMIIIHHLAAPNSPVEVLEKLLEFPVDFADSEGMKTRIVTEENEVEKRELVKRHEFEEVEKKRFGDSDVIVLERSA